MAKPTMLQSLLGRPTQTYSFPEEKVYHSTKQDMFRIAAETNDQRPIVVHNAPKKRVIKSPTAVRALDTTSLLINGDRGVDPVHDDSRNDNEESDSDVFYTPNSSPRTSMASTIGPLRTPSPKSATAVHSTKTSFTHANTSTTSISSSALDAHSLFSYANSDSTRMTSPVQSETEHHPITRVKHLNGAPPPPPPPQVVNGHANQEWAKDVRWLVPATAKATTTPRRRHTMKTELPSKSQTRSKPNSAISKSMSKTTPSIMSSMTALMEEDELLESSAPTYHHPRSSVLISNPRRSGRPRIISHPDPASTSSSLRRSSSGRNSLRHRRSRSLGHASTSSQQTSTSHTPTPIRNSKYASSSADPYDPNITSLPTFTAGDLPSQGTPGYTSLVLPRAPVPLSQTSQRPKGIFNFKESQHAAVIDGKVDLTRSGVAQTTMASVEVVRGLGGGSSSPRKLVNLFRRGSASSSVSSPPSTFSSSPSKGVDRHGKRREDPLNLPLGFTSYRKPPTYVPSGSVLVQVWAVGIDGVDWRLVFGGSKSGPPHTSSPSRSKTMTAMAEPRQSLDTPPTTPKRSASFRSTIGRLSGNSAQRSASSLPARTPSLVSSNGPSTPAAVVGYVPGRSFVGRVLECGWEVEEGVVKKGDWVIGLLDLRKCGALTEFMVVDRHRIHRAPYPRMQPDEISPLLTSNVPSTISSSSRMTSSETEPVPSCLLGSSSSSQVQTQSRNRSRVSSTAYQLTLEELALLPACGVPAYRAVRTFAFAFSDTSAGVGSPHDKRSARDALDGTRRRRVLVLRGHDGAGGMAVQMLARRGWRVSVHVPFGCLLHEAEELLDMDEDVDRGEEDRMDDDEKRVKYCMRKVEERVRTWGGEEVIFDDGEEGWDRSAVVRILDQLCVEGDVFDAILDTIGGKEVWEAGERLLKVVNASTTPDTPTSSATQFPTKGKKEKTSKRTGIGIRHFTTLVGDFPGRTIPSAADSFKAGLRSLNFGSKADGKKLEGKVGYAWVTYAQDVDWEGEDIKDTLREVLRTVADLRIRPWIEDSARESGRVVTFEKAPEIFVSRDKGVLTNGGTAVVKVVG